MTSYSPIPTGDIDTNSPATQPLMTALRDNPLAIIEGSSGAPKIATKSRSNTFSNASPAAFDALGAWSGLWFHATFDITVTGARLLEINASDDGGSTFLGGQTIVSANGVGAGGASGYFDFATGEYHGVYWFNGSGGTGGTLFSGTISGASLSINFVRFQAGTSMTGGVIINLNGGESDT